MNDFVKVFIFGFIGIFALPYLYSNSHHIEASLRCSLDMPNFNKARDYNCYPLSKEEKIARIESASAIYTTIYKLEDLTLNH